MVVRPFFFFSLFFFFLLVLLTDHSLLMVSLSLSLKSRTTTTPTKQSTNQKIASLSSSYQTTKLSMSSIELLLTFCADSGFASG